MLALSVILWHVEGYKENIWALFNLPGRTAVILFFGMSGYPFVIKLTNEHYNSNLILVLISSITIAYISYYLFEKPILSYVKKKK